MSAFKKGRMPDRRVDLRMLKVRAPTSLQLLKAVHKTGGVPLSKIVEEDPAPARRGGGGVVILPPPVPVAPAAASRLPVPPRGEHLTEAVIENFEREGRVETIKGVHAAGGYRLGVLGPEPKQ